MNECPYFTTMYGDAEKGVLVWVLSVVSIHCNCGYFYDLDYYIVSNGFL